MRAEYRKLAAELPALVREFGGTVDDRERDDMYVVAAAVECVDRVLDAIADRARRATFADAVVTILDGAARTTGNDEADARLHALRGAIVRRDIATSFVGLAREILATTERMRTTRRSRVYLDAIEREGQLLVELSLLFLPTVTPAFVAFLRSTAELGNLTDKLLDARGDFRRGEIAVRPGLALHARLVARIARRVPRALSRHPRRLRFVAWSASWLGALR